MQSEFKKSLGLLDNVALVVGIIIGSGIFLTTKEVAANISSPFWILIAWLAGGMISAAGAITFAQLATLYPKTGGSYIYIREAYGDAMAFLYGWVLFLVLQCGSIAALSIGFAEYLSKLFPSLGKENIFFAVFSLEISAREFAAIAAIVVLSAIHYLGTRRGIWLQNILSLFKVGILLLFIMAAWFTSRPHSIMQASTSIPTYSGFAIALIAILWTFSGWHNINFAAEEIHNPRENIPKALIVGVAIVTLIYLLVNFVYLTTLSITEIENAKRGVAYIVIDRLFGEKTANFLAVVVIISILGAINGLVFACPRAYFAMARDSIFAGLAPRLHPVYQTPHTFIVAQAIWSSLLALSGSYRFLYAYVMFSGLLFFALVAASLLKLRSKHPEIKLPWQWSYPFIPIFYMLSSVFVACLASREIYREALLGVAVLIMFFPCYFWIKKSKKAQ